MDWAGRRQILYALTVAAFIAVVGLLGWYAFLYSPPTCTDGVLNQGEFGPDCEGPCAKLCTIPRVDAVFARAIKAAPGVYHAVALVKNPTASARGTNISYSITLYDAASILIAERKGTMDLAPGETRAVFESSIITGERVPVRALMKIEGGAWASADAVPNPITIVEQGTPATTTRSLSATISNSTAAPVTNIVADALLYDSEDVLITVSETRIARLQGRARAELNFTWSEPFAREVVRTDIMIRSDEPAP